MTPGRKPYQVELSRFAKMVAGEELTTARKGQIAEAAIAYRLALSGYEVWKSLFDGNAADWVACEPGGRFVVRLQVRWARRGNRGRPYVSTRTGREKRVVTTRDCDFLVGYDLESDTAFVMPMSEVSHASQMTCHPKYAEAWHLLSGRGKAW